MDRRKKKGIILIVIGICIPLMALPFVSGYSKERGFFDNFYKIGIPIRGDSEVSPEGPVIDGTKEKPSKLRKLVPKRIPFRFFLVITLVLLYMGIVKIAPPGPKIEEEEEKKK